MDKRTAVLSSYVQSFLAPRRQDYWEAMIDAGSSRYPPNFEGESEAIQSLRNIVHYLNEDFCNLSVPEGFPSPDDLVRAVTQARDFAAKQRDEMVALQLKAGAWFDVIKTAHKVNSEVYAAFDHALKLYNSYAEPPGRSESPSAPLVSVHGIRTTGGWQKEITPLVTIAGFVHYPIDYGFFGALRLMWPAAREARVEEIRRQIETLATGDRRISVIAHSFGSHIIAALLEKYETVYIDRLIICGSIVRTDYPWSRIIGSRRQVNAVLNDCGARDLWASLVSYAVSDAGSSGVTGFEDTANGAVINLERSRHRHSDSFNYGNYTYNWIPFLKGENIDPILDLPDRKANWRFRIALCAATVALIGLIMLALNKWA